MRRKGVDEAWCALEEMQRQGITTDKYTVSRMLMKTVGDGRTRLNPSRVYRGISLVERFIDMQPKDVDEVLFNALLDTCCRLKDLARLEAIVSRMRELKVTPSPVTLGILVKTYGQAGDLQKVLQVWGEMEKQRGQANAVTYGCMIDACVKCGHLEKAVEIFRGMRQAGKHRNTILYTTLIKGYGLEKDLAHALELFREMPREGVPYNTITYNSVLDACVKCGDLAAAEGLLREMTAPESPLEPDLITFSTLLKGYCHVGELDKALQVAEAIKARGLRCDELVYNTLMDGCVKANDIAAGVGLFEEMVQSGMRPSAITHSILARLYQRAGYEEGASEAVAQLYQQHGIERPSGGERGKAFGRRFNPRNVSGRAGDQGNSQSPLGSPSAASATSGVGLHRERSASGVVDGGWGSFGNVPAMPGFETVSAEPSAPSTPHAGSLQASPIHTTGPYLPLEALRNLPVPPLPGSTGPDTSPYSQASFAPMSSMLPASFAGSVAGSVAASVAGSPCASPHAVEQQQQPQQGFGMPASPHAMQPLFGLVGAPPQSAPPLPQWPFACNGLFQGPAAAGGSAAPTAVAPPGGGSGGAPGSGVEPMPAAQAPGAGWFAAPVQQPAFSLQAPPQELQCCGATGQPQACFEGWAGAGQQGGVQVGGCTPIAVTLQLGSSGPGGHGQFLS